MYEAEDASGYDPQAHGLKGRGPCSNNPTISIGWRLSTAVCRALLDAEITRIAITEAGRLSSNDLTLRRRRKRPPSGVRTLGMAIQGATMEWWIIGTLSIVYLVLLAVMYLMSARESRALTNYALLILLADDTHATQRASLIELIRATDAKDASQLGRKTRAAITKVAMRLSNTMLYVNRLAWNLKT